MGVVTLDQLVQYVQELPALPTVAVKVLQMTDDPSTSARDISALIASDVALASRVLKIANSSYYGMSRSVSTINEAVLIAGRPKSLYCCRGLRLSEKRHHGI